MLEEQRLHLIALVSTLENEKMNKLNQSKKSRIKGYNRNQWNWKLKISRRKKINEQKLFLLEKNQ